MSLLEVKDLEVTFGLRSGPVRAIKKINFSLNKGERLGIVGESGAGKSVAGFSIINLISQPGYISGGEILFEGTDLSKLSSRQMRKIRGNRISMIFQDPMMTLNPVLTIGQQLIETLTAHEKITKAAAKERAIEALRKVHIPSPEERFSQYPHELSGGMRQRVVIAIALISNPALIIADEPTTALDVTIQAEIMDLLLELCETEDMGMILITHDLSVVSQVAQKIAVMYAGRIVEMGDSKQMVSNPQHPYTQGLINALPQKKNLGKRLNQIPGAMPSLMSLPTGCAFNPRCELKGKICEQEVPKLLEHGYKNHLAACHMIK